jgi:peptidoglycan lytic transglycosylase
MPAKSRRILACAPFILFLASCGGGEVRDSAPSGSVSIPDLPGDAIPRPEARSRYGNGPNYEVFGKPYTVMASASGYSERGVASWYGKKFHGRLTSNREPYDMYKMTAAHKTLPLPSYVRVRNLSNNKSIVVRVNDRGPFVDNRIIDLSYVAAIKLDMVGTGTGLVEVTAITFDDPPGDRPTKQTTTPKPAPQPATDSERTSGPQPAIPGKIYVQVGAFGSRENAERQSTALSDAHFGNVFIHEDTSVSPTLFRVRIGPIHDVIQYDVIVEELGIIGIGKPYLISE